jgi:hypothetical protein
MANHTRSSLGTVGRGTQPGDDVTARLQTARGLRGTGIAWATVQRWFAAGFLTRIDARHPRLTRYEITAAGVAAAAEARSRAAKSRAARARRKAREAGEGPPVDAPPAAQAAPRSAPAPEPVQAPADPIGELLDLLDLALPPAAEDDEHEDPRTAQPSAQLPLRLEPLPFAEVPR